MFNRHFLVVLVLALSFAACSSGDNSHTTATTYVSPPPRQVLSVAPIEPLHEGNGASPAEDNKEGLYRPNYNRQLIDQKAAANSIDSSANPKKPYLVFLLQDGKTFRVGEPVPILFSVSNAKLKDEGGEFRIRYIVDDEQMRWVDSSSPFALKGWTPGEHTVRMELIGPDGWPYRNGGANIVTRKIVVQ
jgi:hypothetical protein